MRKREEVGMINNYMVPIVTKLRRASECGNVARDLTEMCKELSVYWEARNVTEGTSYSEYYIFSLHTTGIKATTHLWRANCTSLVRVRE